MLERAPWGDGADNAFSLATHTLVLTGTPIRSDGSGLFGWPMTVGVR